MDLGLAEQRVAGGQRDVPRLASLRADPYRAEPEDFAVPDPVFRTPPKEPHCTYLVAYEGAADDLPAWLAHYIASHAAIMARVPDIRQVEICTRIDWIGALPWAMTLGAAKLDARTAPAPAELFMNVRRDTPRDTPPLRGPCFFIVALPSRHAAAAAIVSVTGRGSLGEIWQGRPPSFAGPRYCGGGPRSVME